MPNRHTHTFGYVLHSTFGYVLVFWIKKIKATLIKLIRPTKQYNMFIARFSEVRSTYSLSVAE